MNWDAFAAIADLVTAIAVVISLLYLALQLRHSSQINKATIRSELSKSVQDVLLGSPQFSEQILKALTGDKLTSRERFDVTMFNRTTFRIFENSVYQKKLALFDKSEWEGMMNSMKAHLAQPHVQEDWRAVRDQYSGALQALLDPLVPDVMDTSKTPQFVLARTNPSMKMQPNKSHNSEA